LFLQDFWSVVWDNDVRVIVMLTAESEGGQLKCHPYWKGRDFGPIRLRELSEKKVSLEIDRHRSPLNAAAGSSTSSSSTQSSTTDPLSHEGSRRRANTTTTLGLGAQMPNQFNFGSQGGGGSAETPHVIIRKFALSHAAHPFLPMREITQLHFPSWPDFGAPAQPSHLLALVELANVMQRAAFPSDAPGTLGGSPSASRHNGDATSDGATNASLGQRGAGRGSSAADLKRADSDSMVSSWADGPEPSEHARPMLVHCSAGCGRTGAFCTVDSVIDMLKRQRQHVLGRSGRGSVHQSPLSTSERDADGDIDMAEGGGGADGSSPAIDTTWLDDDGIDLIAQTVEDFRGQRLSMVQSLRQFVLCYETVLEWIKRLQDSPGAGIDVKGRGRSGSLAF
jgi:protein-tyrosine phosphatase